MKRKVSLIIATVMMLSILCVNLVGCQLGAVPTAIVVDGGYESAYFVGDAFDYDNVMIKVTYDDGSQEIKSVKDLGATYTEADMSTAGVKSVTFNYEGLSSMITFKVIIDGGENAFDDVVERISAPKYYQNYLTTIASTTNTDADFVDKTAPYKVGTNNKFLFRPQIAAFDDDDTLYYSDQYVKTTAKYYAKDTVDGNYAEIDGDLGLIAVDDNNGYTISPELEGKYVKMELTINEDYYIVSESMEVKTVVCEFLVVDGYNVYDQMGLSVMDDIAHNWDPLKQITLEADSKKLIEYTDVTMVVLHGSIQLDPNLLPDDYFWKKTDSYYDTVLTNLAGNTVGLESKLEGSLKDAIISDGEELFFYLDDDGQNASMQKGLFNTTKCSVSGNYNSITAITEDRVAEGEEYPYGKKNLYVVTPGGSNNEFFAKNNPVPHWSVFKFYKHNDLTAEDKVSITIENLSLSGSKGREEGDGGPGGLMMVNSLVDSLNITNVVADRFYNNLISDSAGTRNEGTVNIINSKLMNAYGNLLGIWRGKVNIVNSTLKDCGGPLMILSDGVRAAKQGDVGPVVVVDDKSTLSAYATGNESWYQLWNAQAIVQAFKAMDQLNNVYFNRTIQYMKSGDQMISGITGETYINIVAVIMPEPSELMSNNKVNGEEIYPAGSFTTLDEKGQVVDHFDMFNPLMPTVNAANTVLFQSGNNFAIMGDQCLLSPTTGDRLELEDGFTTQMGWRTTSTGYLCTYLSTGVMYNATDYPYFAVITSWGDINTLD